MTRCIPAYAIGLVALGFIVTNRGQEVETSVPEPAAISSPVSFPDFGGSNTVTIGSAGTVTVNQGGSLLSPSQRMKATALVLNRLAEL